MMTSSQIEDNALQYISSLSTARETLIGSVEDGRSSGVGSDGDESYLSWQGDLDCVAWQGEAIENLLAKVDQPCHVIQHQNRIGFTQSGRIVSGCIVSEGAGDAHYLMRSPAVAIQNLGSSAFCSFYRTRYPYMAGAMAGGISSAQMVIALGKAGMMGCFGSGGLSIEQIEEAISTIQTSIPTKPYCFNLLHNPHNLAKEEATVNLYLQRGVSAVEASAFITLTPSIVHYRVAGLSISETGQLQVNNKVIAKVSRQEVALQFMRPAPAKMLQELVNQQLVTAQQARLSERVPMADDITVEADSGGHTDNRPLVCLLPAMLAIRDRVQAEQGYAAPVRIGAAGGISTPAAALSAFMMGADYVVTGSVNQSCCEAGTSDYVKTLLSKAEMADVMMAPAADMFEMGVKLQVLKKGTLFPMRAQKLYALYKTYGAIEEIPTSEKEKIERQIFHQSLESVWQGVTDYLFTRNPNKLARAEQDPKLKMALIFRRYLGLSSRWPKQSEPGRQMDYQIWCGPAMGAFNEWVKGSYLAQPSERRVADVALHILRGAVIAYRIQALRVQGLHIAAGYLNYRPTAASVATKTTTP